MMKLTCKAMGQEACPFEATGETADQTLETFKEHAMSTHADAIQKMMADGMTEEQIAEMMRSKMEQM